MMSLGGLNLVWLSNFIISLIDTFISLIIFIIDKFINAIVYVGKSEEVIIFFTNIFVCIFLLFLVLVVILSLLCKIFGVEPGDIDMLEVKLRSILYWKSFSIRRFIRWNFFK